MFRAIVKTLYQEMAVLSHWIPVGLSVGILIYFSLNQEPDLIKIVVLMLVMFAAFFWGYQYILLRVFFGLLLAIACGMGAAKWRTDALQTRLLDYPLKNIRLVAQVNCIEQKNNKWRLYLRVRTASKLSLEKSRLRVTLAKSVDVPKVGATITATATLLPFAAPQLPGDYNFRRAAYFEQLTATGQIKAIHHVDDSGHTKIMRHIESMRHWLTVKLNQLLKGEVGGIAAALVTGDRGYISQNTRQAFTDAGLAHLLAISGLHLSLIAGIIFFIIRRCLALSLALAEHFDLKKGAVLMTLPFLIAYLLISGCGVPVLRAFIMVTIIFLGIMLDRQALSIRSVAIAAMLILLIYPESILSASFQLSFAAVVGLVAAFEQRWVPLKSWVSEGQRWRYGVQYLVGIVATTLIATLATAPLSIYIFNRFSLAAVLGNLLAIPFVGFVIMPLLFLSLISLVFGGSLWGFDLLANALQRLIDIAVYVAALPGAALLIPRPSSLFLGLMVGGGLWVCLWRQHWRFYGVVPMVIASGLTCLTPAPFILLPQVGRSIYVFDGQTLSVQVGYTNKYQIDLLQRLLAVKEVKRTTENYRSIIINDTRVTTLLGRQKFFAQLGAPQLVISPDYIKFFNKDLADFFIDRRHLQKQGAHYIEFREQGYRVLTSCYFQGQRPWSEKRCF